MSEKIKLFQTVADIYNRGEIELSASDRAVIEAETQDLISKSMFRRKAEKMPEGFEKILSDLKGMKDVEAQEAFDMVVDFLKDGGILKGKAPSEGKIPPGKPEKPEIGEKKEKPKTLKDEEKDEEEEDGGPLHEKKESPEEEKEEHEKEPKEEMLEEKGPKGPKGPKEDILDEKGPKGKGPKEDLLEGKKKKDKGPFAKSPKSVGPEDDLDKKIEKPSEDELAGARMEIGARAKQLRAQGVTVPVNTAPTPAPAAPVSPSSPMTMTGEPDPNEKKNKRERDPNYRAKFREISEADKDPKVPSPEEMGVKLDKKQSVRAQKSRIVITREGNIVAHHEDLGPVFFCKPNTEVKGSKEGLVRLANRVRALITYEGWDKAARACNARVLRAGVDEDVELVSDVEVGPEKEPVTEGGDDVNKQEADLLNEETIVKGLDTVTEEKPEPKTSKAVQSGIADGPETLTKEKLPQETNALTEKVTSDGDDLNKTEPGKPSDTTQADGEVDFRTAKQLEDKYRKLYAARAEKAVEEQVEAFARKFSRCVKIASLRMKLNQTPHEFKAAMVDVLASDPGVIQFTDGDEYHGMDQRTAIELTELVASEGHDVFVEDLLKSAAALLTKDDAYLSDVESDLSNLTPTQVSGDAPVTASRDRSRKASVTRKEIAHGNFDVELKGLPTVAKKEIANNQNIGAALSGGTVLGRRLGFYKSAE